MTVSEGSGSTWRSPRVRAFSTDALWGIVLGAASIILLLVVYWPVLGGAGQIPVGFGWPRVILWCLLSLSVLLVLRGWRKAEERTAPAAPSLRMPMIVTLVGALYFVSLSYVGFLVGTLVFAAVLPRILGRPWRGTLPFALAVTSLAWLVLIKLLSIPMPRGIGVFHSLNVWLV